MTKSNYAQKLLDPRWQKKRLEIFQRDNFQCAFCGDTKTTLAIHHLKYIGNPWDCPDKFLKTICQHCHDVIHETKDMTIFNCFKKGKALTAFGSEIVWFYDLLDTNYIYSFQLPYETMELMLMNRDRLKKYK